MIPMTVGLCLSVAISAVGQDANVVRYGFPRPQRKVIVYGWEMNFREMSELRRRAEVMQRQPFDGIMFSLFHEGKSRDEAFIHSARLTDKELAPVVKELSAIRWTTFTDNFLMVKAGEQFLDNGDPGRMDWFDDGQWDTICHNIRVLTRVAVATRCKGLGFDPEPYHASVWNYDQAGSRKPQLHRDAKSFDEYAAVVRRRGAQYMNAIQAEMPRVRIFNLYQAVRLPPSELAETIYSLYPAFINGMLDAAGPEVMLIDGNEYGFGLLTRGDYTNAYVNVKERKLALIDPKNRDRYRKQVQVSVPIYLDDIFGSHANRRWVGTYLATDEKRRLFEHRLFHALDSVDEYVWVYGERPSWFSNTPRVPRWAAASVATIRKQVDQLRLEDRQEDAALIVRVSEQIALRDNEVAELKPAERATPRVDKPRANVRSLPTGVAAPVINGRLDDPAWKQATVLKNFQPLMYFVRDCVAVETTCRVMWDKQFLYFAFECVEPRIVELKSLPAEERRRNRTTLVLSTSAESSSFVRIDVPLGGAVRFLVRKPGQEWTVVAAAKTRLQSSHRTTNKGWTAEWRVAWAGIGGTPEPGQTRNATVTRVRSPWAEHDSWAPQIDPNLIDESLLGTWAFE
ncbi:MAG: hypothetical protein H8E66_30785 [Planctomycetes bacterium]|nr:hypothetical protein [Planctomycetota bacterium]